MTPSPPRITNQQARHLFMARQGLIPAAGSTRAGGQDKAGLLALIRQLGFVQIDSIRTVERAHHMILFARDQTYKPEHLRQLLEEDRQLFEHWTHDAALIPTDFYAHWRRRFDLAEDRLRARWRKFRPTVDSDGKTLGFEDLMGRVISHVERHGPTRSRDLKAKDGGPGAGASGWWDWHPSKTALEFLWRTGALSVSRRDGFQKVYDLCARVIPLAARRDDKQTPAAFMDWACGQALDRLGFATAGELAAYWGSVDAAAAKAWCMENRGGRLIEALVESADGSPAKLYHARPELLESIAGQDRPPDRLRVLSPFDPLIRDRKRLRRLFNFDYRIEVFVPEAQRRHGYYVFPMLEGDRLIGRIDMKARRRDKVLHVTGLWLEPRVKFTKSRSRRLVAELNRHARFVGLDRVTWEPNYLKS